MFGKVLNISLLFMTNLLHEELDFAYVIVLIHQYNYLVNSSKKRIIASQVIYQLDSQDYSDFIQKSKKKIEKKTYS